MVQAISLITKVSEMQWAEKTWDLWTIQQLSSVQDPKSILSLSFLFYVHECPPHFAGRRRREAWRQKQGCGQVHTGIQMMPTRGRPSSTVWPSAGHQQRPKSLVVSRNGALKIWSGLGWIGSAGYGLPQLGENERRHPWNQHDLNWIIYSSWSCHRISEE